MNEVSTAFANVIYNGLKRKSLIDCARWAEKCRIMGEPYPGKYDFKHFPWAREMHNANCEQWIGQKSAQMGFTEVALNRVFYTIDIKRADCLYVLPSEKPDASQFSASRFAPALELSPYLKNLFSEVNNVGHKRAGSTNLFIRGSRSRSSLKSIPVSLIVLDELDEMTLKNLPLASERQAGQRERQTIKISTPTVAGRGINFEYELSTQEHFHFRCPHCSKFIELEFPFDLKITGDDIHDPNLENSYIECNQCHRELDHNLKSDFLKDGIWVPINKQAQVRGFYINQLYSSTETPYKIATAYFLAQTDPLQEQEFYNSKGGLVHEVKGMRLTDDDIVKCIKDYQLKPTIPPGRLTTIGIDIGSVLHYEIDEWFLINNPNTATDLNMQYRPRILDYGTVKEFEDLDYLMRKWMIRSGVIDAHPEKRKALEFARRFEGLIKLCIYGEGSHGKNMNMWANEPTITVDRTAWLDLALGRFRHGMISVPSNVSDEYKEHLKSLVRQPCKDKNDNPIARYVKGEHKADHFAHTRNYSEIALNFIPETAKNYNINIPT